jgi:hypothetical protein
MSEATGRAEMERRLVQRSLQDDAFRQRLLSDPKAAVEDELGTRLPEEVRVVAVEEATDTVYLVLPNVSAAGGTGELSIGSWRAWPAPAGAPSKPNGAPAPIASVDD